jgi:ATP-dependent exoDNAse (exonuclease V) beta subunit
LLRWAATERRHLWPVVAWRFGGAERRPEPLEESWLEEIPEEDAERLRRFCSVLAKLRASAPVVALDDLVERTMTAFDYDLALLSRPRGRGRMANVRKLIRLAREFEEHEGRDLRGFLVAAEELTARDEREGLAATQPEEHDGVRLMTVHAAKGLEFPVVAVPDLGRGLAQGEFPGDVLLGRLEPREDADGFDVLPRARFGLRLVLPTAESYGVWKLHELHAENVAEAAEEGGRLVHVAATRAQERLILSGIFRSADLEASEPAPNDTALRRLLPALRERGWDPESRDGELELPPPPAAEAIATPPRLAIRVNAPSAELAEALSARLEPPPIDPMPAELGTPPLERPSRVTPVGHLSYSALAEYERCGYRFYVERLLGLDAPPAPFHPDAEVGEEVDAPTGDPRARRLALGNAVHAALEWSARHRWGRPDGDRLAALLAQHGITEDAELSGRAAELVDAWLGSPLRTELEGTDLRAEVPFAIALAGSVVRGQIDLLAGGAEPTVLDYKTDALGEGGPAELAGRYAAQREIYALAAAAAPGSPAAQRGEPPANVRAVHVFLEAPSEPVIETFDRARLAASRQRLERLIAEIRAGGDGFAPTAEPSWTVCNGCPAAAHLCPVAAWRPQWASASIASGR